MQKCDMITTKTPDLGMDKIQGVHLGESGFHLLGLNDLLLEEILSYLPIPTIAVFRRTSKKSKQVLAQDHRLSTG